MAALEICKNRFFRVISVCVFCLAFFVSSPTDMSTKSVWRVGKVMLLFLPAIFLMSYFFIWRNLVTKPRKCACLVETHAYHHGSAKHSSGRGLIHVLFNVWTKLLLIVLLLAHLSFPCMVFLGKTTEIRAVPLILFICLGIFFELLVVSVGFEVAEFVLKTCFPWRLKWKWFEENWHAVRIIVTMLIVVVMVTASIVNAAQGPIVKHVELPVRKLPLSMNGLTIVQLSDIHLGPTVGRSQLQQSVDTANELNPDIVVITGDLVDSTVENLAEAARPLQQLKARHGVFYVTGNHEYYTYDVKAWIAYLESLGIVCLPNQSVKITSAKKSRDWFYLAGTNDLEARRVYDKEDHFNLDKAMERTDRDHAIILLAHQPSAAQKAVQSKYDISLILSGHTHGGQLFPVHLAVYFIFPYFAGIYQPKEGTYVYVSSGTWYNGPPMRLFSTAEITFITLLAS